MGLDMYIERKIYIGAHYQHTNVKGEINITAGPENKPVKIDLSKVKEIVERAGYWRKANQIHNWFVKNVQDGEDNCKEYYVSREQLMALRETCIKCLEEKNPELLPPQEGFFFGSTAVDEYYWDDIKETITMLNEIIEDDRGDLYYRASW